MNIPDALTARKKVESAQYSKAQTQLNIVSEAIQKAIDDGRYSCGGDGYLDGSVISILESKGYIVKNDSWRNESSWSVTW